jgi:hypothetical protein
MKVEISGSAYAKIFLHATKYTSFSVGGYILGKHKGADFEATDIVPICHGNPVGPVFDISAEMVRNFKHRFMPHPVPSHQGYNLTSG